MLHLNYVVNSVSQIERFSHLTRSISLRPCTQYGQADLNTESKTKATTASMAFHDEIDLGLGLEKYHLLTARRHKILRWDLIEEGGPR